MNNFFYTKAVRKDRVKNMWEYLKNHYRYHTLNSWNGLTSIANDVKLYNLQLPCLDIGKALEWLEEAEGYEIINRYIRIWEREHEGYCLGFNGRSDGYLVLYNKDNARSVLPDYINDYDEYEDFKASVKDNGDTVGSYKGSLQFYTKLVEDFDKFCDTLREILYRNVT